MHDKVTLFLIFVSSIFLIGFTILQPEKVYAFSCLDYGVVSNCTGIADGTTCYLYSPIYGNYCAGLVNYCSGGTSCSGGDVVNRLNGCQSGACLANGGGEAVHESCSYGCSGASCNPNPCPTDIPPTPTPRPFPTDTPPTTTTAPGEPTSTPAPTAVPTTAPPASWSGSCTSPTSFQINGPSNILTHARYSGGGFAWQGAAGGTTQTVNSNQNFSWYSEDCGAGCETFRGSATCYATNATTSPELRLPPANGQVSIEVIMRYPDNTDYDGYGLPAEGIRFYGFQDGLSACDRTSACVLRDRFCAGYEPQEDRLYYEPPRVNQKFEGTDYVRYGYHQFDFNNWPICRCYTPEDLWRFVWPRFPSDFQVTNTIGGGEGHPAGSWLRYCCVEREDEYGISWDDQTKNSCLNTLTPGDICDDTKVRISNEQSLRQAEPDAFYFGASTNLCALGWRPFSYFTVKPPTYLSVTQNGSGSVSYSYPGSGTITCTSGAGSNVLCPTTFRRVSPNHDANTYVTLTATPSSGYRFSSWSNCDDSTDNVCYVYMHKTRTVTVVFNPTPTPIPTFEVRVSVTGGGLVTGGEQAGPTIINCTSFPSSPCSASFVNNRTVTLTANSINNTNFTGWGGDGSCSGTNTTCSFTMTRDRTVTATFVPWLPPWMKVSGDVHTNR